MFCVASYSISISHKCTGTESVIKMFVFQFCKRSKLFAFAAENNNLKKIIYQMLVIVSVL